MPGRSGPIPAKPLPYCSGRFQSGRCHCIALRGHSLPLLVLSGHYYAVASRCIQIRCTATPYCALCFTVPLPRLAWPRVAMPSRIDASPCDTIAPPFLASIFLGCSARYEPLPSRCEPCTAVPFRRLAYSSLALLNNALYRCLTLPFVSLTCVALPCLRIDERLRSSLRHCITVPCVSKHHSSKPLPSRALPSRSEQMLY